MTNTKIGFTLAEVLITLTIIGVIAAMTIPNLMQSYRKHQVEVEIKAAYSILSNALSMAKAEHGPLEELIESSWDNDDDFCKNFLEPYIKFNKKLKPGEVVWANTDGQVFSKGMSLKKLNGKEQHTGYTSPALWTQYSLSNGMALGVFVQKQAKQVNFIFDINGKKGANQIGHDIFYFVVSASVDGETSWDYVNRTTGKLVCGTWAYDPLKYKGKCNGEGFYCSCPIMYNGWKIPDDYPVKKW